MFVVYSFVSFVLICLVKWVVDQWRFYDKLKSIPGPKPLPVIGNVLDFLSPTVIIPNVQKFINEFGPIFKVSFGPIYTYIFVSDPDVFEYVLSSNTLIEKSRDYDFLKKWLGNGLITAPGYIWKQFRKTLTPAFHFKILDKMSPNFERPLDILIKKLTQEVESGSTKTDIYPFITLYSLDIICETTMGIPINAQERKDPFVTSTRDMLTVITGRVFSVFKQFDFLYHITSDYNVEVNAIDYLHKASGNVIKSRKKELSEKNVENRSEVDEFGIKEKRAFLDLMLDMKVNGEPISDVSIRNNVDTIMFAGHDTTASAISFCLYSLANHPHVQQKLYEEIVSITTNNANPVTLKELSDMKYLDLVLKETLRMYPAVHCIARKVHEDFEFKGTYFPKGVTIAMSTYFAHRNEEYFPDPEKFDPERFSLENNIRRHPYCYVPFSAGPRNCIGQKFAIMAMKFAVFTIIKNFELVAVPENKLVLSAELVLKSKDGIYIKLLKRQQ